MIPPHSSESQQHCICWQSSHIHKFFINKWQYEAQPRQHANFWDSTERFAGITRRCDERRKIAQIFTRALQGRIWLTGHAMESVWLKLCKHVSIWKHVVYFDWRPSVGLPADRSECDRIKWLRCITSRMPVVTVKIALGLCWLSVGWRVKLIKTCTLNLSQITA